MPSLRIKNWVEFQHYKDRNPPWIKLHYEILTSRDWVMLDDASKLLAVVCMLLASRNNGSVPLDPAFIARVAYIQGRIDFNPLVECGFLVIPEEDASECKRLLAEFRPEEEAEGETYIKKDTPLSPPATEKPLFRPTNQHATFREWMKASDLVEIPDTWFQLIKALKVEKREIAPRSSRFLKHYTEGNGKDYTSDNWPGEFWKWFAEKPRAQA